MTKDEALKLALDALENCTTWHLTRDQFDKNITAIKVIKLAVAAQRTWVGLTDEQIDEAAAPDLLEALLAMFASIPPYTYDGTPTIPDATVALANAAISKATRGAK